MGRARRVGGHPAAASITEWRGPGFNSAVRYRLPGWILGITLGMTIVWIVYHLTSAYHEPGTCGGP